MKESFTLLLLSLLLFGCYPEGRVFTEHKELSPDFEWLRDDTRTFEVPIEDSGIAYDLSLSFRYVNGYPFKSAKVKVTETSPSGEVSVDEHVLTVRKDDGSYIGEAGYDIWDSQHLIVPNKKYPESGTYTYEIEHAMKDDPLNYVMEIGVVLDMAK